MSDTPARTAKAATPTRSNPASGKTSGFPQTDPYVQQVAKEQQVEDTLTLEANAQNTRVEQKWGFGHAPVKPQEQKKREEAAKTVLDLLKNDSNQAIPPSMENLSCIKGLYSRSRKQDQWDWFTVWQQLGRPGFRTCQLAAEALGRLRKAIEDSNTTDVARHAKTLRELDGVVHLTSFLTGQVSDQPGIGYIYLLSTREQPRMLKIGYTERPVEVRLKEINRATGVVIPYGVRAMWAVTDARSVEAKVHARLNDYRVRKDREFFELDWRDARRVIDSCIEETHSEI